MGGETFRFHQYDIEIMNTIRFSEVQHFRVKWAWAGVIALNVLFLYAIFQQVVLGRPFGSRPVSTLALVLVELCPLLLAVFLASIKLKTTIDDTGIRYRFFPFQPRPILIEWHELKDAYIRQYNSFHEYGGWGIRIGSPKTGWAVNTSESGNLGLQLQFQDGKLLLIGTRRPGELKEIIDRLIREGRINRGV
jgi:hypothetical protein